MAEAHVLDLELHDVDATERLGSLLALALLEDADSTETRTLLLHGDLGAGTTTLSRALLHGLGVTGSVRSPTYTLIEPDATTLGEARHLDLYRIADPGELDFLGMDEGEVALWLVEWPERGQGALPPPALDIRLSHAGDGRRVSLQAHGQRATRWLERLETGFAATSVHP